MSSPGTMDTVEVKVFVKYFPQLQQVVNPSDITASLFAKGLLTEDEKESADNTTCTSGVRMNKLLDAVMKAILIDSRNLNDFLDILGAIAKYKPLVDEMRRDLAGNKRSEEWGCNVWRCMV